MNKNNCLNPNWILFFFVTHFLGACGMDHRNNCDGDDLKLYKAYNRRDFKEIEALIARNIADPNAQCPDHLPILNTAAAKANLAPLRVLIEKGVFNVNILDKHSQTPIMYAAGSGDLETVNILLSNGAKADVFNNRGWTALMSAASGKKDFTCSAMCSALIAKGALVDRTDNNLSTAMMISAGKGFLETTKTLLIKSKNPNIKDKLGQTAFSRAVDHGRQSVVKLMLEDKRVDPSLAREDGWTPIMIAARRGNLSMVSWLLKDQRVDPNMRKSTEKLNALMLASYYGHTNVVQILLNDKRVDHKLKDANGYTARQIAEKQNHKVILSLLPKDVPSQATTPTPSQNSRGPGIFAGKGIFITAKSVVNEGKIISGGTISMKVGGNMNNTGKISGKKETTINAGNLRNEGSRAVIESREGNLSIYASNLENLDGTIYAKTGLVLELEKDFNNLGGTINSG